jgi:hypothetical protein
MSVEPVMLPTWRTPSMSEQEDEYESGRSGGDHNTYCLDDGAFDRMNMTAGFAREGRVGRRIYARKGNSFT